MNVCLLLLRVLVCMRLKKIDFCCQLGTLTYHVRHCICSTTCALLSVPIHQMVSSLQGFNLGLWHPPVGGSSAVIIHYSMDPDFQHRSSPQCHIQQDDLYLCRFPSLLIAVLHALPKIPNLVSSFHSDSAWNFKEQTSTGNSQAHHPLSLQSSIKSVYFRAFTFMWLHTIFFPWHVQLYCNQLGHY